MPVLTTNHKESTHARYYRRRARDQLDALIDEVAANRRPLLITGNRNKAVLVSGEDWRAIQESLALLSIPRMLESISEGMVAPLSQCVANDPW